MASFTMKLMKFTKKGFKRAVPFVVPTALCTFPFLTTFHGGPDAAGR